MEEVSVGAATGLSDGLATGAVEEVGAGAATVFSDGGWVSAATGLGELDDGSGTGRPTENEARSPKSV